MKAPKVYCTFWLEESLTVKLVLSRELIFVCLMAYLKMLAELFLNK